VNIDHVRGTIDETRPRNKQNVGSFSMPDQKRLTTGR
jgi:hypothetical protein